MRMRTPVPYGKYHLNIATPQPEAIPDTRRCICLSFSDLIKIYSSKEEVINGFSGKITDDTPAYHSPTGDCAYHGFSEVT
ncbi:MAG: hypothetical protein ACXQTG_00715 [Methanoculleaceae archaeon]